MEICLTFEIHAHTKEFRGEMPWWQRAPYPLASKTREGVLLSLSTPGTLAKEIMTGHTLPSSGRFRKPVCYYRFWKQTFPILASFLQSACLLHFCKVLLVASLIFWHGFPVALEKQDKKADFPQKPNWAPNSPCSCVFNDVFLSPQASKPLAFLTASRGNKQRPAE